MPHFVPLVCADNFDYNYSTTTYPFGPTDDNEPIPSLVIPIPIINDGDNELNETFKLTLEVSADGEAANVTEGPIRMTVVLIKDDDGKTKAIQYQLLAKMLPPLLSANTMYVCAVINLCVNAYCLKTDSRNIGTNI